MLESRRSPTSTRPLQGVCSSGFGHTGILCPQAFLPKAMTELDKFYTGPEPKLLSNRKQNSAISLSLPVSLALSLSLSLSRSLSLSLSLSLSCGRLDHAGHPEMPEPQKTHIFCACEIHSEGKPLQTEVLRLKACMAAWILERQAYMRVPIRVIETFGRVLHLYKL